MECDWYGEAAPCAEAEYIIAWRCDKCGAKNTLTLCPQCYSHWLNMYPEMYCSKDSGTLSYKTIKILTGETTCQINPQ